MPEPNRESAKKAFDDLQFNASDPQGSAQSLYDASLTRIDAEAEWYEEQAVVKQKVSYATRGVAVVAIGISAIFLDFAAFFPKLAGNETLPAAVATVALVVAGLVLLVDRTFIITKGMTRFRVAEFAIRKLQTAFAADFNRTVLANQPLGPKSFYEAKGMALDAMEEVFDIVAKETAQWQADTQTAIDALRQSVDDRLGVARSRFKEAGEQAEQKAKAELPGNLNITLQEKVGAAQRPGRLQIQLEGPSIVVAEARPGATNGFPNLPPGNYRVAVFEIGEDQPQEILSKAITLAPGKTEDISV